MIEAQRRVFEGGDVLGERHLIGPVELGMLFEVARRQRECVSASDNERLVRLNNELTDALRLRGEELMKARARIAELEGRARPVEGEAGP